MLDIVKEELSRMLDDGIISKVTEPTDWCASIVPVPKKNGKLKICLYFKTNYIQ